MSRIKFTFDFSISEDQTAGRELGQSPPWQGVTDAIADGGTFRRKILAHATDVLVGINGLSGLNWLAIKSDQTITFKKNSTMGEPTTLEALGVGAMDAILIMTTAGITSLYVSNPGATDAEVTFSMAGSD